MLNIQKAFGSDRVLKALTGLSKSEFTKLKPTFEQMLQKKLSPKKRRERKVGGGRKHTLLTAEAKLFFILFYIKCYPTFDVAGFFFGVNKSQTNRWVGDYLDVLEQALGQEVVLPERKIERVEEFFEKYPLLKDLYIDGVERPTQRPKDYHEQKDYYSGKKKRHTRKNIIVADANREILLLSQTHPGRHQDYGLFKESSFPHHLPDDVSLWVDSGFQGIESDYPALTVYIPQKKPRGGELNLTQKVVNSLKARLRVVVEHAIWGLKRLNALAHIYRNRRADFDDRLMLVACGLWNFHLKLA